MDRGKGSPKFHEPGVYRICARGVLSDNWLGYVQGMTIAVDKDEESEPVTTLTGELVDQAALLGVLNVLYDLRLKVLSVECLSGF